ncbi:hypothetical protein, partial [Escherichia coli]
MPPATSEWELPDWNDKPVAASAHSDEVWEEKADAVTIADDIPDLGSYEPVETIAPLHADAPGIDDIVSQDKPKDPSHNW